MPRGLPRSGLEASHAAGSGVAATGVDGLTDPRANSWSWGGGRYGLPFKVKCQMDVFRGN